MLTKVVFINHELVIHFESKLTRNVMSPFMNEMLLIFRVINTCYFVIHFIKYDFLLDI